MRKESKNPVSGRQRRLVSWLFFPLLFWLPLVFMAAWSYCSHLLAGRLAGAEKLWLKIAIWAGSFFAEELCPLHSFLPWASGHLIALLGISLFFSLLTSGTYYRGAYFGVEHGSSHWATKKELAVFRTRGANLPIGDRLYLTEESQPVNRNVYLQGTSGAGKSFRVIIPAIEAQTRPGRSQGSLLVTDVKGANYRDTSKMVKERGVPVWLLNLANPWFSHCYSPLELVHEERKYIEIPALALSFAKNVRDEEADVGQSIWEDTFRALLCSVWLYQYDFRINPVTSRPESRALWRTGELIRGIEIDNKTGKISRDGEMGRIISAIEYVDPLHPAISEFEFVAKGMRETVASVLFTAGSKVSIFGYPEIQALTMKNEIPLDEICEKPGAIYLNYQIGSPFRVIAALFIEQLFASAYYVAETRHNGSLPINLKLLLDELPQICRIYTLPGRASTVRSYNIDLFISSQSRQQLEVMFKNQDKTLINNCATEIYLGSKEKDALNEISERLGDTTTREISRSSGERNSSESSRPTGRKLALPAEMVSLPMKYEIVLMQYRPPIFCEKFKTEKQPYYPLLGGKGAPENNRNIEEDFFALSQLHRAQFEEVRKERLKELKE